MEKLNVKFDRNHIISILNHALQENHDRLAKFISSETLYCDPEQQIQPESEIEPNHTVSNEEIHQKKDIDQVAESEQVRKHEVPKKIHLIILFILLIIVVPKWK